jgi:hypothetical protein
MFITKYRMDNYLQIDKWRSFSKDYIISFTNIRFCLYKKLKRNRLWYNNAQNEKSKKIPGVDVEVLREL